MSLRSTRISVNIPAIYSLKGNEAEGIIVDISSSGVGLDVKQIFVIGDIIRVQFKTSDTKSVDFWGIVKNVSGNFIGLNFEEISNDNVQAMEDFVGNLLHVRGLSTREDYE